MARTGKLTDKPTGVYLEELMFSTCEITMAGIGGPLIDFDGNFVGMNIYAKEGNPFVPRNKILEVLKGFLSIKPYWEEGKVERKETPAIGRSNIKDTSKEETSICSHSICDPERRSELKRDLLFSMPFLPRFGLRNEAEVRKLTCSGYPVPIFQDYGMRLLYNFEEEFHEDISHEFTKLVLLNMSRSVVSLASFSGEDRVFACTGVLIDCDGSDTRVLTSASLIRTSGDEDKIVHNLKIEVCLPDKQHVVLGELEHWNSDYNIAVIRTLDFRCLGTAKIYDQVRTGPAKKVAAVGRIHKSGKLMATSGMLIVEPSELDCKELMISTCKITKAGIGGPLIDFNGNFIVMNFCGLEQTPYLPTNVILKLLRHFDTKGADAADFINDHKPKSYSWHVPKPYWCYPTWHELWDV